MIGPQSENIRPSGVFREILVFFSKKLYFQYSMSKTLVLEISDEVYSSVERRVKQKGSTPEIFVIESIVKNLSNTDENLDKEVKRRREMIY